MKRKLKKQYAQMRNDKIDSSAKRISELETGIHDLFPRVRELEAQVKSLITILEKVEIIIPQYLPPASDLEVERKLPFSIYGQTSVTDKYIINPEKKNKNDNRS
jgi:hypothetical protein